MNFRDTTHFASPPGHLKLRIIPVQTFFSTMVSVDGAKGSRGSEVTTVNWKNA